MQKPDGLIFDMDGTLWDASQTYAESWNTALEQFNIDKVITPQQVAALAGVESRIVVSTLLPDLSAEEQGHFYLVMTDIRRNLIPKRGGILYDGVKEGLEQLSKKYPIFILSNCAKGIIPLFIEWAGISGAITGNLSNGDNAVPKNQNIKLLMERYSLRQPIYVGDTDGDAEQTYAAGIPFVWVSYGFGNTARYHLKFSHFTDMVNYYLQL